MLGLLAFAMLATSLDQYNVVVALPSIGRELGFSAQTLHWVFGANAVTSAGFLLLGGRAADLLGRRRIFATSGARSSRTRCGGLRTRIGSVLVSATHGPRPRTC
jgi:MFS family permease